MRQVKMIAGSLALIGLASSAYAQQAARQAAPVQPELSAPAISRAAIPQRAVVLRADNQAELLRRLPVERRLDLSAVRAQPVIALEQGEADLTPVLANPVSPINIADRLKARPQLATVRADTIEVAEIPQGLVVRQFLAYKVGLGTCTDPSKRRALEAQGGTCFDRASAQARRAELADPASARFVEDRAQRARIAAQTEARIVQAQAEIDGDIAQLRAMFADPAQRAAIEAEVGVAEAARLAALPDDQLQAEIVNNAEIEVEEVMFVPAPATRAVRLKDRADFGRIGSREALDAQIVALDREDLAARVPSGRAVADIRMTPTRPGGIHGFQAPEMLNVSEDIAIEAKPYLTGFTLGLEHEWSRRVSISVNWCLIGCTRTYYLEPYAGFGYGLGLRLPVRVEGTYRYRHQNGQERAWVVPQFTPFNGNDQQYRDAGLSQNQSFDGQEMVAELQAYAGFLFKLPAGVDGNISASVGADLTDRLPAPYHGGQFTPPAPGYSSPDLVRTVTEIDLIANKANFGIAGARIHPAVKFNFNSDGLKFKLRDHVAGKNTWMTTSGEPYAVALDDNHRSRFSISDPVYNLGFEMTPGIEGRVFVDIAVWGHTWKWPVWFPQLSVDLPPGGLDFTCHAGTTCSNQHQVRAAHWSPQARDSVTTRGSDARPAARSSSTPARAPTRPPRASDTQDADTPNRARATVTTRPARTVEQAAEKDDD
ncbi:coiled-coil domain-containing protein [Sphingomicrobium arenosum]|uniref:hypothetical protein n=1 Tax=Sphingomicrobium arenosum TaxID=2233861 RepID=UPI002240FE2B|nr:hypothetical protein [Sphingomicrobium arenosum]